MDSTAIPWITLASVGVAAFFRRGPRPGGARCARDHPRVGSVDLLALCVLGPLSLSGLRDRAGAIVRWKDFRADIESVTETKPEERKSNAGRKPYDIRTFRYHCT